jgi:hypothetical protein
MSTERKGLKKSPRKPEMDFSAALKSRFVPLDRPKLGSS